MQCWVHFSGSVLVCHAILTFHFNALTLSLASPKQTHDLYQIDVGEGQNNMVTLLVTRFPLNPLKCIPFTFMFVHFRNVIIQSKFGSLHFVVSKEKYQRFIISKYFLTC